MSSFVISDNSDLLRHTNVSKAYNEHKNENDHRKVGQSAMPAYTYIQLIVVLSVIKLSFYKVNCFCKN